ncbi:MAG: Smr/MutS family protein, partial [Lysobacterales bacterium]
SRVRTNSFRNENAGEVLLYGLKPGTETNLRKKDTSERDVFRAAMSGVQQLKPVNRLEPRRVKPDATPRQRVLDEKLVLQELQTAGEVPPDLECGEELFYLRPGHSPQLMRGLRRGRFSVADTIDLHHMSEAVARKVLLKFLQDAMRRGFGCVRVVHGKGLRSRGGPKLKVMTQQLLRKHPSVIAFASCRPVNGGTGAVDILLHGKAPIAP